MRQLELSGGCVSLNVGSKDQVPVITLGILVNGAEVVSLFLRLAILLSFGILFRGRVGALSSHVDDREWEE